ncbi:MAG: KTSC domain-containing protein [Burkholderiales bacterium]
MPMIYTDVNSTAIASIGYDPTTGELEVTFTNGASYTYTVDPVTYENFLAADSKGSFYARHIRG